MKGRQWSNRFALPNTLIIAFFYLNNNGTNRSTEEHFLNVEWTVTTTNNANALTRTDGWRRRRSSERAWLVEATITNSQSKSGVLTEHSLLPIPQQFQLSPRALPQLENHRSPSLRSRYKFYVGPKLRGLNASLIRKGQTRWRRRAE